MKETIGNMNRTRGGTQTQNQERKQQRTQGKKQNKKITRYEILPDSEKTWIVYHGGVLITIMSSVRFNWVGPLARESNCS